MEALNLAVGAVFNKITEATRKAKAEQEAYNRRIDQFYLTHAANKEFLSQFAGLNRRNVDLLGVAKGEIDPETGEYNTLFSVLNDVYEEDFRKRIAFYETRKRDAQKIIAEQEKIENKFSFDSDDRSITYTEIGGALGDGIASDFASRARTKIDEQQKIVEESNATIKQLNSDWNKLIEGNRLLTQQELKRYDTQFQINALRAKGDISIAKALEDQLATEEEIHNLRRLGVPNFLAKLYAPQVVKTRRAALETGSVSNPVSNDISAEIQVKLDAALEELSPDVRSRFQDAISKAQDKQEFVQQILAESRQLLEEVQTPIDAYVERLKLLAKTAEDEVLRPLSGGLETFKTLQEKALQDLVGQTTDYEEAIKRLLVFQREGGISAEQYADTLTALIGPIDDVSRAIDLLKEISSKDLIDPEAIAATEKAIADLGVRAVEDLRKSGMKVEDAIKQLLALKNQGAIDIVQFGQAFQDLTDPIEGASEALIRLKTLLSQNLIDQSFFEQAKKAIEGSKDYRSDLRIKKQKKTKPSSRKSFKKRNSEMLTEPWKTSKTD